jgi:NADH-quinone oxidoreductase subunit J
MVLAHRERLFPKPTQRELATKRIKDGPIKAPLPAPGVFARHNAVDIPALLPDGTPSELSVSRVLTARGQMRPTQEISGDVGTIATEIDDPLGEDEDHDVPIDSALDGQLADDGVSTRGGGRR